MIELIRIILLLLIQHYEQVHVDELMIQELVSYFDFQVLLVEIICKKRNQYDDMYRRVTQQRLIGKIDERLEK